MRIVTIDGVDCCACCAPHVQKTGEIGLAKVISVQKNKTGVRVTMLAGRWALQDYGKKQEEVHEISKMLSAKVGEVAKTVAKLKEEKEKLEYELVALRLQMIQQKAEQTPIVDGIACIETEGLSGKEVREVCNCLMEKAEIGVVLNRKEKDEEEFQYSIGSKEQDVRQISILLKEQLNGRGGGQPKMIQGTAVGTKEQVEKVLMDWREQRDD
jgi:alanyl-tRNA synthetase